MKEQSNPRIATVLRHVRANDAGALAAPLERAGYRIGYVEARDVDAHRELLLASDLLIVLGGPYDAHGALPPFLETEIDVLSRRIAFERPTLGICLGSQLLARAAGAEVRPRVQERGWQPLRLTPEGRESALRHLDGVPVMHWHQDAFDLPAGARRLASTDACPNQAFALGPRILALQFHPESDGTEFVRLADPSRHGIGPDELARANAQAAPAAGKAAQRFFDEWLARLEGEARI